MDKMAKELVSIARSLVGDGPIVFQSTRDLQKALESMGAFIVYTGGSGWSIREMDDGWDISETVHVSGTNVGSWYSGKYHILPTTTMSELRRIYQKVDRAAAPAHAKLREYAEGLSNYLKIRYPRGIPSWPSIID